MAPEIWSFLETEDGGLHDTAGKMAAESRRTAKIFNADACAVICGQTTPGTLEWRMEYNVVRPRSSLGYRPPVTAHQYRRLL
jgi:hypothetical protein